ncbi:MAG: hypothetical protein COT71_02155 [Candidatus Andersenbacteria bacterium CG10_big_fil_rev_8_21_14_0_10_54_11]|uniref:PPC domain-containing protein n=1 Tax=Candidatus Andersenbacteria bacterium CG10_big_fil_rev_8_21_14_0_10_54_11 TaxID=1974485 RepID=A0A2M6WZI2_9BACT|nr:MAG: hypothetical protein COT71_02155 [Candidatus Andersenbacteria bacterium CG10_big_fil_rev_8_21_14_0_10_54_11]
MKVAGSDHGIEILSFPPGEEVIAALTAYCMNKAIHAGSFTALGAVREVILAWYDVSSKSYRTQHVQEKLEIAGVTGTISLHEEKLIVHAHGVFSDQQMHTMAGHINSMVVSGACELTLWRLKDTIMRTYNQTVGLALMEGDGVPASDNAQQSHIFGAAPAHPGR